jgi:hypothetical protein
MAEPSRSLPPKCINCNFEMHYSCTESEKPGFMHDVYECSRCRSTQSFVTANDVILKSAKVDVQRRAGVERRSRVDTRPEEERRLVGERRSQIDRRVSGSTHQPSKEQLALFAKRVRRAMREERARHLFGASSGEGDFSAYSDVLKSLEWIEGLANV